MPPPSVERASTAYCPSGRRAVARMNWLVGSFTGNEIPTFVPISRYRERPAIRELGSLAQAVQVAAADRRSNVKRRVGRTLAGSAEDRGGRLRRVRIVPAQHLDPDRAVIQRSIQHPADLGAGRLRTGQL